MSTLPFNGQKLAVVHFVTIVNLNCVFVETSTCLETIQLQTTNFTVQLIEYRTGPSPRAGDEASSLLRNIANLGESWGIVSMLKALQKQLQRSHQQQCLKIDTLLRRFMFFGRGHFIASTANRKQRAGVILVHHAGTTCLRYSLAVPLNVYAVFPPPCQALSVRIYLSSDDC